MNLFSYIDKYGGYSFEEKSFNEIDNAVFSSLSYVDLEGLVSRTIFNKRTISDVGREYFLKRYSKKNKKNILAVRQAIKLLRYIKDTKRYGSLLLYSYVYKIGDDVQFSAMTIELSSKLVYVSFEGTDHLVSGWKEDFMMSYKFPVPSQKMAIDYLNKNFLFSQKKIILGGHSKGGNLAMVSAMYANFLIRSKIIKIYNNDGPGLLLEQITSKKYLSIKDKLVHIVPNYSIVGLILRHSDDYIVVRSARKDIYAHDLFAWVVRDTVFERVELSLFSKNFDERLLNWLNKYDRSTRERFVGSLFDIFSRAEIYSLIDILENKKLILQFLTEVREIDEETKEILKDFLHFIFKCFKDVKVEELKSIFENK